MSHGGITGTSGTRTSGDSVLNLGYTRTIPGLLKMGQMAAKGWPSWYTAQFFQVVALWFLCVFTLFFLMHLLRLQAKMPCINWALTEFFHYSVGSVLTLIASVLEAVKSGSVPGLVAGAVFGFIATFLMLVSLWTSYSATCGPHPTGSSV